MDPLSIVMRLGQGRFVEDLAEALVAVADEVVQTGKAGQVGVTLKLSNQQAGDVLIVVEDQIARKPPKKDPRGAYLFSVDGELYTSDPRQVRMDFRAVPAVAPDVRETGDGPATIREA